MPITRQKFSEGSFKARSNKIGSHPITTLLRNKSNLAFSVKDMKRLTKMKEDTIRSMLRNLIKKKLVEHKPPYFAWKLSTKKKR